MLLLLIWLVWLLLLLGIGPGGKGGQNERGRFVIPNGDQSGLEREDPGADVVQPCDLLVGPRRDSGQHAVRGLVQAEEGMLNGQQGQGAVAAVGHQRHMEHYANFGVWLYIYI